MQIKAVIIAYLKSYLYNFKLKVKVTSSVYESYEKFPEV